MATYPYAIRKTPKPEVKKEEPKKAPKVIIKKEPKIETPKPVVEPVVEPIVDIEPTPGIKDDTLPLFDDKL
jgi:hypothetical protein